MSSVSITNISGTDNDFDRPSATGPLCMANPGTSCLATIVLSLRDENHSPIEAPRIKLAFSRLKPDPPSGTGPLYMANPGTSCLATIALSLRDENHSPIEGPRIKLAFSGLKPINANLSNVSAVACILSRRDSTIVARHEVPGIIRKTAPSQRDD
jgi:hypothetical protein